MYLFLPSDPQTSDRQPIKTAHRHYGSPHDQDTHPLDTKMGVAENGGRLIVCAGATVPLPQVPRSIFLFWMTGLKEWSMYWG
jgi:hypothetical protein